MVRVQGGDADRVYDAAARWVDEALRSDGSLFTPGQGVWSGESVADLYRRFVERPDLSAERFEVKFSKQLDGATAEIYQLASELLYVYFLISDTLHGTTKRKLIELVLSWSPSPVAIPDDLATTLDGGLAGTGTAYNTQRPSQLAFLLEFSRSWKGLPTEQREGALNDAWEFKELAFSVTHHSGYTMREALLHLVHPEVFERIVSRAAKQKIAHRFADLADETEADVDRRLVEIRRALAVEYGEGFDFYDPPLRHQWQPDTSAWGQFVSWAQRFYTAEDFDESERDYKLQAAERLAEARAAMRSGDLNWVALLRRGFGQQNLTPWQQHDRFLKWVEADATRGAEALVALWDSAAPAAERLRAFLQRVPVEALAGPGGRTAVASYLLTAVDPQAYPVYRPTPFRKGCELAGHPTPAADADEAAVYEHALAFLDAFADQASARGLDLRDRLDAQSLLWAVTKVGPPNHWSAEDRQAFMRWRGDPVKEEDEAPPGPTATPAGNPLEELAGRLFLDPEFLTRVQRLLEVKRQVVFYGPPGTGKTFVAQKLAETLAGRNGGVELVQFHPSYAYEDFIEGYRPDPESGGFRLVEGPLKRLAAKARENPGGTFVLIIDELNRGNLATVFGELYFLLEYRDRHITLQYSADRFSMPENLYVIGTMNTADRSISLLDAALRRRFYFLAFLPDTWPVEGLLRRWLDRHAAHLGWIADIVDEANRRLADRHAAVGPSYFMTEKLNEEWVELVWEHAVLPYIEDRLFGEPERVDDFSLDVLRAAISGQASVSDEDGETVQVESPNAENDPDVASGTD